MPYFIYNHSKKYDFFQDKKSRNTYLIALKLLEKSILKIYIFYEKVNFAIKKYFFYSAIVVGEIKSIN